MKRIGVCICILLLTTVTFARKGRSESVFGICELRCEQKTEPSGIVTQHPRFSWKVKAEQRGFRQGFYRILVADDPRLLDGGKGNFWDSGKTDSGESVLVPYRGKPLASATVYYWKVQIWNAEGRRSSWSRTGSFVTGMFRQEDWAGAQWIAMQADDTAVRLVPGIHAPLVWKTIGTKKIGQYGLPVLRKEFLLKKKLQKAVVCVSGLGHFDLFLNGKKVGNNFLDPGWTNYDKTALYVTFDVTGLLDEHNALGMMLGNGFYNVPRERYFKQLVSYGAPKMKLCLCLVYDDGTTEKIISDNSWKVFPGPLTYSSIYGGEDYDANLWSEGWTKAGYDDSGWKEALVTHCPAALRTQLSEPLRICREFPVIRRFKNAKGNWIYDFGQNFSGIIKLHVSGKQGETIVLRPGELLNADSTVNQSASGGPYYFKYKLCGDSVESWQPRFTYYGFRYVEVEGGIPAGTGNPDSLPQVMEIKGLHTSSATLRAGCFHCSEPIFNKTYELIDWAVRSNLASILTDCPHREKLGWLEVAHLMQYSMQYLYDLSGLYSKLMDDMQEAQTEKGLIPSIAPEYVRFADGFENSPEWGSAFVIIPWYVWRWYGDKSLLEKHYPAMKRYVGYLTTRAEGSIVAYGLGDWFDIGPKAPGYSQLTSNGLTATAMYYYNTRIMAEAARLCGYEEDISAWEELAVRIKKAFNARFRCPKTGGYDRNSQTANAMALYMGLVPEGEETIVYENLLRDLKERNYALTAGDIGYRYVLQILEERGDSDIIVRMNNRYDVPGYGWQLAHGATALTESWQAYGFVSNNHCMLGHLMEWLFGGIGGIKQEKSSAAFRTVRFEPCLDGSLEEATTTYESPYGTVRCEWKYAPDGISLYVAVPPNSKGIVCLPFSEKEQIVESGRPLQEVKECRLTKKGNNSCEIEIGSGDYFFRIYK